MAASKNVKWRVKNNLDTTATQPFLVKKCNIGMGSVDVMDEQDFISQ